MRGVWRSTFERSSAAVGRPAPTEGVPAVSAITSSRILSSSVLPRPRHRLGPVAGNQGGQLFVGARTRARRSCRPSVERRGPLGGTIRAITIRQLENA